MTHSDFDILIRIKKVNGNCHEDQFLREINCGECPVYDGLPHVYTYYGTQPSKQCVDEANKLLSGYPVEEVLEALL